MAKKTISAERLNIERALFRDAFLSALDSATVEACRALNVPWPARGGIGATDADLPELFRCIDAQLLRILHRADVTVTD